MIITLLPFLSLSLTTVPFPASFAYSSLSPLPSFRFPSPLFRLSCISLFSRLSNWFLYSHSSNLFTFYSLSLLSNLSTLLSIFLLFLYPSPCLSPLLSVTLAFLHSSHTRSGCQGLTWTKRVIRSPSRSANCSHTRVFPKCARLEAIYPSQESSHFKLQTRINSKV